MIKVINIKQGNKSGRSHPLPHYYRRKTEHINFGVYHIRIGMLLRGSNVARRMEIVSFAVGTDLVLNKNAVMVSEVSNVGNGTSLYSVLLHVQYL